VGLGLGGCDAQSLGEVTSRASALGSGRSIDVLFMVDNSSSMTLSQTLLLGNFPKFMDVLTQQQGGMPDVHVAVISSDMGAGDGSITGCAGNGDDGGFQSAPRGTCTNTTLQMGATFISNVGGVANYTAPNLSDVFTCIAPLGESGCGFEHQLASITRALGADGAAAPTQNQGFLRPEADLAIILITNEDDCSAPVLGGLYDTNTNTNLASPLGPPANFRCNEFGHRCGNPLAPPQRLSPNPSDLNTTVTYTGCQSAEESGMLVPVATVAAQIKALKPAPAAQILVEAIAGPPTPYVVHWRTAFIADTGPWPEVLHSCGGDTADGGTLMGFADPSVRIAQFVQAFGANGAFHTICTNDFSLTLQQIKDDVGRVLADEGGSGGAGGAGGSGVAGSGGGSGGVAGSGGGSGGAAGSGGGSGGAAGGAAGSSGGARGGSAGGSGGVTGTGGVIGAGGVGGAGGSGRAGAGGSAGAGSGGAVVAGSGGAAGAGGGAGGAGANGGGGGAVGSAGRGGAAGTSGEAGATGAGNAGGRAGGGGTTGAAGHAPDGSTDAGKPPANGGGCGCEVQPSRPAGPALVMFAALGVVRRRRGTDRRPR
jgi:hypothetical protein